MPATADAEAERVPDEAAPEATSSTGDDAPANSYEETRFALADVQMREALSVELETRNDELEERTRKWLEQALGKAPSDSQVVDVLAAAKQIVAAEMIAKYREHTRTVVRRRSELVRKALSNPKFCRRIGRLLRAADRPVRRGSTRAPRGRRVRSTAASRDGPRPSDDDADDPEPVRVAAPRPLRLSGRTA